MKNRSWKGKWSEKALSFRGDRASALLSSLKSDSDPFSSSMFSSITYSEGLSSFEKRTYAETLILHCSVPRIAVSFDAVRRREQNKCHVRTRRYCVASRLTRLWNYQMRYLSCASLQTDRSEIFHSVFSYRGCGRVNRPASKESINSIKMQTAR